MCIKLLSTYFYVTPILYKKFGEIPCSRTGDNDNSRILGKCHLLDDLHLNMINIFFITKISPVKFGLIPCNEARDIQIFHER